MSIAIACPACGSRIHGPDQAIGHKINCPKCGKPMTVASPGPANRISERDWSSVVGPAAAPQTLAPTGGDPHYKARHHRRPKELDRWMWAVGGLVVGLLLGGLTDFLIQGSLRSPSAHEIAKGKQTAKPAAGEALQDPPNKAGRKPVPARDKVQKVPEPKTTGRAAGDGEEKEADAALLPREPRAEPKTRTTVTGFVVAVEKEEDRVLLLLSSDPNGLANIHCYFKPHDGERVANMKKGEKVRASGVLESHEVVMMLKECELAR